jgi:hypothetical protein
MAAAATVRDARFRQAENSAKICGELPWGKRFEFVEG